MLETYFNNNIFNIIGWENNVNDFNLFNNLSVIINSYILEDNIYMINKDIFSLLGLNSIQNGIILDLLMLFSIACATYTILSKNPIISVLYLIGLYVSVASYIILIGLQFIGLSYILIYVGAISILFIFILMLINIRISELLSNSINSLALIIIIISILNSILYNILPHKFIINFMYNKIDNYKHLYENNVYNVSNIKWDDSIIEYNTISSLGNTLYSDNLIIFLEASLILLLAMIGAIIITIKSNN